MTFGSVKKLGWYISTSSNFWYTSSRYECDGSGKIIGEYENGYTDYTYSNQIYKSRLSFTAGMVVRVVEPVSVYFGAGWGFRNLYWVLNNGTRVKNTDYSYSGISLDGGFLFYIGGFSFSAGIQAIGFKYMEVKGGIGFSL